MEPIGSIQGLASGIDFRALVDAIVEVESRPTLLMARQKAELDREAAAWGDIELRLRSALDRSAELADPDFFRAYNASVAGDDSSLTVSADATAVPGSFAVEVLQVATRERVGSDVFATRDAALGLSGEFVVSGRAVQISETDTLDDIAERIDGVAGSVQGGVSASVVGASTGGFRIVLTANDTGAAGVRLSDGADGVLSSLGFADGTTSIRHQTSDGATTDAFTSATAAVGALLGFASAPPSAAVGIGALAVTIDLSTNSLDDIAAAINAEASGAGSSIRAEVVLDTDAQGNTVRRIDISGTTAFTDAGGILESLGILEGGRSAVAQQVGSAAFTDGDAASAATAGTLLSDLWVGGAAASVQVGDTLTINGTHGDGATFTKVVSVEAGDTLQDLLDELNSGADGFGTGSRTATASIVDGAVVVTDDTGGTSRLGLSIIAHNEGGGALDFGDFAVATAGRDREIASGVDAELLVDGTFHSRSTNRVTDVVEGVSLNLADVSASGPVTVDISRDVDAMVQGIEAFVQAYNAVSEFVLGQFTGVGAEEGQLARPLSGNQTARAVRDRMRAVLQTVVSPDVSSFTTLTQLGIEANRDGLYDIDSAKLRSAIESDPLSVARMFTAAGTSDVSELNFLSAASSVPTGRYDVLITTAAAQASVTGTGFGGSYVDDGTADTLTITDTSTDSAYAISLSSGMTLAQIVEALNDELSSATARRLESAVSLRSDASGTFASGGTALAELHDAGGTNLGVANGDTFTISGSRSDGSSFFEEFTVTNAATQTLGTLQAEIATELGTEVVLDFEDGVLTATAVEDGTASFTLSVSSDNLGGGTFALGSLDAVEEGRGVARISAEDVGGQLSLTHDDHGSADGFAVAFEAGGADGTGSLGVAAATYAGVDVAGTIGGHAANGLGRRLEGSEGTDVAGFALEYTGSATGAIGAIDYARGIAALMESVTDGYMDGSDTSIQGILDRIDTQKRDIDTRIERFDERIELRAEGLIRRFTALEESLARAQSEAAWLQSQLGSLVPSTSLLGSSR